MKNIGAKLKKERINRGLTLENMAIELDISPASYRRYETEEVKLIHPNFYKICKILLIEPFTLFRQKEELTLLETNIIKDTNKDKDIIVKLVDLINYKDSQILKLTNYINELERSKT